jgi:hypothetical protein
MKKLILSLLFIISSCSTVTKEEVPKKKEERLSVTANKIIPKAKKCFSSEYENSEDIIRIVEVFFDIFNDGKVLVTKIDSRSNLTKSFKKCIQRTYESFEFSDPMIKDGKKIKFKQTLEFKSVNKG